MRFDSRPICDACARTRAEGYDPRVAVYEPGDRPGSAGYQAWCEVCEQERAFHRAETTRKIRAGEMRGITET